MLADTTCKNAKPKDKPYKLSDGYGLYLFVTPTAKLWNMAYRFGGKQKKLSFGAYPAITLTAARARRDAAKTQIANGVDPGMAKQQARREQLAARSFGEWADEWLEKKCREEDLDQSTIDNLERFVAYLVGPGKDDDGQPIKRTKQFGLLEIKAVLRPDVVIFLRGFEKTGKLETRDRVRSTGEQICFYADVNGSDYNPFRNLQKQLAKKDVEPRPALIGVADVVKLFQTIAVPYPRSRFSDIEGHAMRFISLTVVRPGEVATIEWSDIDFDNAQWHLSPEKMKMDRKHIVPLSRQALAVLKTVRELTGHRRFVFSGGRDKPICGNTLNRRLRRLGYDTEQEHCAHGFRTTFSTLCNRELDADEKKMWDGDAIEMQLAHVEDDKTKATYNRTDPLYLMGQRTKLLQHWADRIDSMVGNNVVALSIPIRKTVAR